jgi:hypothetical protein
MAAKFLRRFKENDETLRQEAVRASRDRKERATNWRAVVFWGFVAAAAILLYFFMHQN